MKKALIISAITIGVLGIGFTILYVVKNKKDNPKDKDGQADWLIKKGFYSSDKSGLMSFGDDFISAWYEGAKKGDNMFTLNGKTYSTTGGKTMTK